MLRAAETYGTPAYSAMRDRCIAQDLSWAQPAKKWEAVLTELKYGPGPTPEATADKNSVTTPTQKV
jgi:granule-bound starch synthase